MPTLALVLSIAHIQPKQEEQEDRETTQHVRVELLIWHSRGSFSAIRENDWLLCLLLKTSRGPVMWNMMVWTFLTGLRPHRVFIEEDCCSSTFSYCQQLQRSGVFFIFQYFRTSLSCIILKPTTSYWRPIYYKHKFKGTVHPDIYIYIKTTTQNIFGLSDLNSFTAKFNTTLIWNTEVKCLCICGVVPDSDTTGNLRPKPGSNLTKVWSCQILQS